jgi:hypothetical protein
MMSNSNIPDNGKPQDGEMAKDILQRTFGIEQVYQEIMDAMTLLADIGLQPLVTPEYNVSAGVVSFRVYADFQHGEGVSEVLELDDVVDWMKAQMHRIITEDPNRLQFSKTLANEISEYEKSTDTSELAATDVAAFNAARAAAKDPESGDYNDSIFKRILFAITRVN